MFADIESTETVKLNPAAPKLPGKHVHSSVMWRSSYNWAKCKREKII